MTSAATTSTKKAFSRLPSAIKPIKYHLRLKPDLEAFTFQGWMRVELDVIFATDTIVCNAAELHMDYVRIGSVSAKSICLDKGSVCLCEDAETMTVKLKNALPIGNVLLVQGDSKRHDERILSLKVHG